MQSVFSRVHPIPPPVSALRFYGALVGFSNPGQVADVSTCLCSLTFSCYFATQEDNNKDVYFVGVSTQHSAGWDIGFTSGGLTETPTATTTWRNTGFSMSRHRAHGSVDFISDSRRKYIPKPTLTNCRLASLTHTATIGTITPEQRKRE